MVEAKGKDKRGNGTAGATVTAAFSSPTPDTTEVSVGTDLAITGKPAQFGRGVMQDVSDKLLQAFVDCLKAKVGAADSSAGEATAAAGDAAAAPAHGKHLAEPAAGAGSAGGESPGTPEDDHQLAAPRPQDDALDLGATVLPILIRSYWKQLAGGLLVLLILKRLLGRRH